MTELVEPPFSVVLAGHGAAGARAVDTSGEQLDDGPELQETLRVLSRVVHVDPDDPDHHFILGRALMEAQRVSEALPALRKAVALHPDSAEYRLSLGQALWRAGHFAQAADAFSEAARLQPDEALAWSGAGAAHLAAGRDSEALAAIDAALRLDPSLSDAHANRGIALWRRGNTAEALEAFETAVGHDAHLASAHRNLGLAHLALGRAAEALTALASARACAPGDVVVLIDTAEALGHLGRREDAYKTFREALDVSPSCLDGRPEAREAFLALETTTLRKELAVRRSARETALAALYAIALGATAPVRALLGLLRRLPTALLLGLLALGAYPLWNLTPVYFRHYLFVDDLGEIAATPLSSDSVVYDRLLRTARKRGLASVIDGGSCQISSDPHWRQITCRYRVGVSILPGLTRSLALEASVERFFIARDTQ